jgi:hypothetical protein
MMVRLVGSPVSWSAAGHRAVVAGPREERQERDDGRGRLVSERAGEGERAHASGPRSLVLLGRARASVGEHECARVGRACCWAEQGRSEEATRVAVLFFFFKM